MAERKSTKLSKVKKVEAPINNVENDIVDIDLSAIKRKRFRVDQDNNRILELNTSDMNVVTRLQETYPKLIKLVEEAVNKDLIGTDKDKEKSLDLMSSTIKKIDTEMRKAVDYIFDSNVSAVCAPDGNMYDLFNGMFRYEYIISTIARLYETNMEEEYQRLSARMKKHTSKYIK